MQDLEAGKLPPLEVTIQPQSIVLLCAGLLVTFILIKIANQIL